MEEKSTNERRETRSFINIDGLDVEVIIYGHPNCLPTPEDIRRISEMVSKGYDNGSLCSMQPHKDTCIYGRWKKAGGMHIPVGSVVEFSTSGKYNPGFHTTEKYVGTVLRMSGDGCIVVAVDDVGQAIIPIKHVERVISR